MISYQHVFFILYLRAVGNIKKNENITTDENNN